VREKEQRQEKDFRMKEKDFRIKEKDVLFLSLREYCMSERQEKDFGMEEKDFLFLSLRGHRMSCDAFRLSLSLCDALLSVMQYSLASQRERERQKVSVMRSLSFSCLAKEKERKCLFFSCLAKVFLLSFASQREKEREKETDREYLMTCDALFLFEMRYSLRERKIFA